MLPLRFAVVLLLPLSCGRAPSAELQQTRGPKEKACRLVELKAEVQHHPSSFDQYDSFGAPIVANGGVYYSRTGTRFQNAPEDLEIVRFLHATNTEDQVTSNDVDDFAVDGREGALAFLTRNERYHFDLCYLDNEKTVLLQEDVGLYQVGNWLGGPTSMVRKDRMVWRADDAVFYYDGRAAREISAGLRNNSWPYLRGNLVVWTAWLEHNTTEVFLKTLDGVVQLTNNELADDSPVLFASNVVWLQQHAVMMYESRTGTTRQIHPGPCGPPDATGEDLVFTCGETPPDYPVTGQTLFAYDGDTLRTLYETNGVIYAVRIDGGRVAWIEYDEGYDLCGPSEDAGSVFVMDMRQRVPVFVDRVGGPCLCCGAFWPEAHLSLRGDLVAWNYGSIEGEPRGSASSALLSETRSCD